MEYKQWENNKNNESAMLIELDVVKQCEDRFDLSPLKEFIIHFFLN